jgi:5'-phosphate synthase pdxT subunit
MRIGVIALQGDFSAHARSLVDHGHDARLVRRPADLDLIEGLVLPGGESTTQLRLLASSRLAVPIVRLLRDGAPALATCAGLILLARTVVEPEQESLGLLDVTVARNAWGRQLDSFEAVSDRAGLPLVFIRAPRIRDLGAGVEVLDTFGGEPILVRQANIVAATFHPELTGDGTVARLAFPGDRPDAVIPARFPAPRVVGATDGVSPAGLGCLSP